MSDRAHRNPIDVADVTDEERATMLVKYLDAFKEEFGRTPKLMPLDSEGKEPIAKDRFRVIEELPSGEVVTTTAADAALVDGYDAAREIAEEGARGFAIYAGRPDHGTEGVAIIDHDDPEAFPAPTGEPTLEVLSGSGRGPHETYRNDLDDPVRNARLPDAAGEVRAENYYAIVPGSVHPSGGVYHVTEHREIATLADADLTDEMRPTSRRREQREKHRPARDASGDGGRPDDETIGERLQHAFEHSPTGEKYRAIYNGQYASAGYTDRSKAEYVLANWVDMWVGSGDRSVVESVLDAGNLQKWDERTDRDYRDSVLADVGYQDWYADESSDDSAVAIVPNSPRARAAANGWRWHAVDRDTEGASDSVEAAQTAQRELWEGSEGIVDDAMHHHRSVLVDVLMGGGKTYSAFKIAAERGEQLAYFAPRKQLYEQAVEYAVENGVPRGEIYELPAIGRDCPTYQGKHGEAWQERIKRLYFLGMQPKTIHSLLGDAIPCKDDGECQYEHRCDFDPEEYQVLIGNHVHAYITGYTKGRAVVVDEDPSDSFTERIGGETLIGAVNAFLGFQDSPPFDGWHDLIENRRDPERLAAALEWFDTANGGEGFDFEPDERNVLDHEDDGYHAFAPHAVYAILNATPMDSPEERAYPFETAYCSKMGYSVRFFTTTDQHSRHYVEFDRSPDLRYANSVIALDGTPLTDPAVDDRPHEWQTALGRPLDHERVLDDEERGEHLRNRGYVFMQSSSDVRPYSSGRYNDARRDAALLATVRDGYGEGSPPLVFTAKKVEDEYRAGGFVERDLASAFDHPNNLRGSNAYADERLLVELGSSHHGDHELRRRAARLGETVPLDPEGKGMDRDYGPTGNAILRQMRENQVAQDVLRVGRDGKGALVVLDTCAYPDWLPVEDDQMDVALWSKGERSVRDAWHDRRERGETAATTAEIADHSAVGLSDRHLRRVLSRFAERGLLDRDRDDDEGRAARWIDAGLGSLDPEKCAETDLPDVDLGAIDAVREERAEATETEPRDPGKWEVDAISSLRTHTPNVRNFGDAPVSSDAPAYSPSIDAFDSVSKNTDHPDPPPDEAN